MKEISFKLISNGIEIINEKTSYYEKDNIMCYFDDVVLHVMEMTYSALDKVINDNEDNSENIEDTENNYITNL